MENGAENGGGTGVAKRPSVFGVSACILVDFDSEMEAKVGKRERKREAKTEAKTEACKGLADLRSAEALRGV